MYIKSIVLDGFKSYGQRTEINGFDPEFNAITGLNGTGKSNILDSICFVLGITQLSNVRVTSLQDLVYKCGQSGVTKATVSITFDNGNKEQSPVGFEDYDVITVTRQVVMGGKNKYLINGVCVQNKRVQDMFCSIQLNVNNPHFLIMQGRITKVLNMRPPEILSMIEEAAGTRMYEVKKQATQKTIEKKDAKLLELDNLVREEITPKLNKLKDERKLYLEFQRNERELQNLTGIYLAWQFLSAKKLMQKTYNDLEKITQDIEQFETNIETNNERAKQIDNEVAAHEAKDSASSEELNAMEAEVKRKEKVLAKANAVEKTAKINITNEEKKMNQLSKGRTDDETALNSKELELNNMDQMFQNLRDAEAADAEALLVSQRKFEAISAGMVIGEDGEAATLQEQLIKTKQDAAEAATEVQQATMQLKHNQRQLRDKQKDIDTSASDYKKDKTNMDNLDKELKNITQQLQNLNFDENKMADLQDRRRTLKHECRGFSERMGRFEAQYPQSDFQYHDPEPNFNRRSVKGLVCKLISVKDRMAATALETAAGGRLFNVITDTEVTSKKLLQGGQLQYRTTIIPLNKIKGNCISRDTVNYAQELVGKENVRPALSLIQFSNELQPAMEYIFGNVFICKDMNVAKRVTFDKRILRKCVTLEGDVVDPSGTLSGGAAKQGGSFLLQLEEYKGYLAQLQGKEQELLKLEAEVQNLQKVSEKYTELKHKYDITSHNLSLAQRCLQQTSHYQQQEEIDHLKRTIAELTQTIETCYQKEKSNMAKAKSIEDKIKDSKGNRETELKEAEAEMKRLKKQSENSKKLWKQKEQDFETLKLEIAELKKAIVNGQEQIQVSEKALAELIEEYEALHKETEEAQATVTKLQDDMKEKKSAITTKNKDIQKKLQEKDKLLNEISDMELEIKKLSHKKKELEKKCAEFKAKEAELQRKLRKDDTRLRDAEEMSEEEGLALQTRIVKAQDAVNKLKRTVNTKAQSMFDQEEKQYTSLLKKKIVVENDKKKLLSLIEELDKKKICFLKTAYEQISKDFGSIFNTLLPGTDAKLKPPEGKSILDGLEIKVGIGGMWKDSLNELSGGQKSLVALSLILSMLLFKPAPLYILDEVDAALDLSHTQNIGTMLRKHFRHSQFIIVSLKDGMFNNANVLFRTKFVDGMSGIVRTVTNH